MLATIVCLATLSTNSALAAEVQDAALEIPAIQPGQAFYINEKGKIILDEMPAVNKSETVAVAEQKLATPVIESSKPASEVIIAKVEVKNLTIVSDNGDKSSAVTTREEKTADTSIDNVNEANDNVSVQEVVLTAEPPADNAAEIPESVATESIATEEEFATTVEVVKIPENIKVAKSMGEITRDKACEQMMNLLNRSISSDGVRLMVEMLNRNRELSNIDKLNFLIGYWRAIDRSDIPQSAKVTLTQVVTETFE